MTVHNFLIIRDKFLEWQRGINHLPICRLSSPNSPPFTMRYAVFYKTLYFPPVSQCYLRNPESLNNEGDVRETTLIRRPMQKVVFGLSPGLWNEERNHRLGKNQAGDATDEEFVEKVAELERQPVDGLWWRPVWKESCLMCSCRKCGEPENGSPGCLAKSRVFRLFCFSMVVLVELLTEGSR